MIRKSCWMILVALLAVAIAAPNGYADNYTITFTGGFVDNSATCAIYQTPCFAVPSLGLLDVGTVIDDSGFGESVWIFCFCESLRTTSTPQNDAYSWFIDFQDDVFGFEDDTTKDGEAGFLAFGQGFGPPDSGTAYVTDTSLPTPEPPSIVLTLVGIGLLVVMRKRIAKDFPLTS